MKLVQKILSHGLLIAFIVAAFFIYTNRTGLFPQWFGTVEKTAQHPASEKPDEASARTREKQPSASLPEAPHSATEPATVQPQTVIEPQTSVSTPAPAQYRPVTVAEPELETESLPEAATQQTETTPVAVEDVTPPEAEPVTVEDVTPAETAPVTVETAPVTVEKVMPMEADVVTQQPAGTDLVEVPQQPSVAAPDAMFKKQLNEARQYYWQHKPRAAEVAYQALAKAYPQNPDVWGEIGNFYFSLRQRKSVIEAYSRCVGLLIDQGEPMRARQLLNILYRLGAPEARELEIRMQQAGG